MPTTTVRIFPPLGVARLGDSAEEYFIGPERRRDPALPTNGLRDASHAIKRQAARFRLYAYDENDALIGEVTADTATIAWTVELANTKASADRFGRKDDPIANRNAGVTNRESLNLRTGGTLPGAKNSAAADLPASKAAGMAMDLVCNQTLFGKPVSVKLGTITTDVAGRLIALGGHGKAASPTGKTLGEHGSNFANHDEWYDDVADGPVNATVTLPDGSKPTVKGAWLIVAPPKFAPELRHVVSLYDTLLQTMFDRNLLRDPAADPAFQPSFAADIYPILERAFSMRWLYANGASDLGHLTFHKSFNHLPTVDRHLIFSMLGIPPEEVAQRGQPATGGGGMPKMWSDAYDKNFGNGTLSPHQYKLMTLWAAGQFVNDWAGHPLPPEADVTPEGLTEAALEPCIGAPFYPGIEASWKLRDVYEFTEPFRLNQDRVAAGDITKQMSLPWQSDFLDCAAESGGGPVELVWWPAQRPIDVLPATGSRQYASWARTAGGGELTPEQMVMEWPRLGFILRQPDGSFAETDRIG